MLHITNGRSVAIGAAALPGRVLPWNDVLHEGPVPARLSLREMSAVRARFIADCGWGKPSAVRRDFAVRDRTLAGFRRHSEVVLWFEHDLFDQLQLMQILDWFSTRELGKTRLSLINVDHYLGSLPPERLAPLFPMRRRVTRVQLGLASAAWSAFRSADPTAIERLLATDTSALRFLRDALLRHLQDFPSVRDGLSRTERRILELVAPGMKHWGKLFGTLILSEEPNFLGDAAFRLVLDRLARCRRPLVKFNGPKVHITKTGREVLAGRADHARLNGIDCWLGGVHLHGPEASWRWDEQARRLRALEPGL